MADNVQYRLEQMLPELKLFQDFKIFSEAETKEIVKQRKQFEYKLVSYHVSLADYLKYVQYEINLDKLTRIRVKQKNFGEKKKKILQKHVGPRRVHFIYQRATSKYSNNLELWLQYIKFCIATRSHKSLTRTFARALRHHPLSAEVWLQAAFFEYEYLHNINTARVLIQRALRILKEETSLWVNYLRLELLYRKKITDRLNIMGVDPSNFSVKEAEEKAKEEKKINEEQDIEEEPTNEDDTKIEDKEDKDIDEIKKQTENLQHETSNPFFAGKIASIIADKAIESLPTDLQLRFDLFKVARQFSNTEEIQTQILQSIRKDFSDSVPARTFLSRIPLMSYAIVDDSDEFLQAFQTSVDSFNSDVTDIPTKKMYKQYTLFYRELIAITSHSNIALRLVNGLSDLYDVIQHKNLFDEELYAERILFLINLGFLAQAKDIVVEALAKFQHSLLLVETLLKVEIALLLSTKDSTIATKPEDNLPWVYISALFSKLDDGDEGLPVWRLLIKYSTMIEVEKPEYILSLFRKSLVRNLSDIGSIKLEVLRFCAAFFGIKTARDVFQSATEFPPTTLDLYRSMIQLELSQLTDESKIRRLFEAAVHEKNVTHDIFSSFVAFELLTDGGNKRVPHIQFLAKKTLKQDEFVKFESSF